MSPILFSIFLFLPLFTFGVILLLKNSSKKTISSISIFSSTIYLILCFIQTAEIWKLSGINQFFIWFNKPFIWFKLGQKSYTMSLYTDHTTLIMMNLVYIISWMVLLFSTIYMKKEKGYYRYTALIHLFIFSMIGIVLSGNLVLTFFCWELVGICSYFLISFWYEKKEAIEAAQKGFLINKIGDVCFLMGIIILSTQTKSLDLISLQINYFSPHGIWPTLAALGITIGCLIKSAQFPFYNWLSAAMQGPTPVSALMHSATMVAAGIFILIKFSCILTSPIFIFLSWIGIITIIISSISALWEWDIKKTLAYSTIAQLGYMIVGIGTKNFDAAFFHLITHAIAKAGLFLCIGFLIYQFEKFPSDIRMIKGIRKKIPLLFFIYLILACSSAGIPFFSGYLSKEALLTRIWTLTDFAPWFKIIFYFALASSFLTVLYTSRNFYFIFLRKNKEEEKLISISNKARSILYLPLTMLSMISIGFIFSIHPFIHNESPLTKFIPHIPFISNISLFLIIGGIGASYFIYRSQHQNRNWIHKITNRHFGLDFLYEKIILTYPHHIAFFVSKIEIRLNRSIDQTGKIIVIIAHFIHWIDKVIVDGLINGLGYFISRISFQIKKKQQQSFQQYARWLLLIIVFVLIYLLWIH